mgnify:CR=1 FL=1
MSGGIEQGPRHLAFHPNREIIYGDNEQGSSVTAYDFDTESGLLEPFQTLSTLPEDFAGENSTAQIRIHPEGRFLYVSNRGHDSIAAYRIGKGGLLEQIAITSSGGKSPQNLEITADGRSLLVANMSGGNVAVFAIDPATGKLSKSATRYPIAHPACIVGAARR